MALGMRRVIAPRAACMVVCAACVWLFNGCVTELRGPALPPAVQRVPETPTQKRTPVGPLPTPTATLEESAIGEVPALTPPPGAVPAGTAVTETPLPTPTTLAEAAGTSAEPESLLTRIGPATPPNVAAALRLIEDARDRMRQQAYDAALDRLERAVAIDPTSAHGYYFLAQVHLLKNDYDQAIAFASRAAALSARTDHVLLGRIHSLEGAVFEQVGRYPDARKAYQKAIDADPNNLAARVGVGRLSSGE